MSNSLTMISRMTIPPASKIEFNRRRIAHHETLGQQLRRVREHAGVSVDQMAGHLKIRRDYVEAIERSDYRSLPSQVFVKNYVRNYTKFLQLNWATIEPQLADELRVYESTPHIPTLKRHLTKRPLRAIEVAAVIGIIFVIVAVAAYFSFEIGNIVQPPPLELVSLPTVVPADQRVVTIAGQTAPEAIVSINDQVIPVQADGSFSQVMTLQPGSNVFKILAKTKRSRSNSQYFQIYVENN